MPRRTTRNSWSKFWTIERDSTRSSANPPIDSSTVIHSAATTIMRRVSEPERWTSSGRGAARRSFTAASLTAA